MAVSKINKIVGSALSTFGNHNFVKNKCREAIQDPARAAASAMVLSIVSKDLVGCGLYTYQSFNNKKIPKEKRPFVAGLDLINGIVMVFGQLAIGKLIERGLTPKLFGKMYSGTIKNKDTSELVALTAEQAKFAKFDNNKIVGLVKEAISIKDKKEICRQARKVRKLIEKAGFDAKAIAKSTNSEEQIQEIAKNVIKKIGAGSKNFDHVEKGFGIVVTALATTALVKRTLAPLISTPLAGAAGDKLDKIFTKKADPKTEAEMRAATIAPRFNNPQIDKKA